MIESLSVPSPSPSPAALGRWSGRSQRLCDATLAALALFLLAPLILLVCLAILVESGRPILFRQIRLGRDGKPFTILKFKKFSDARDGSGPHLTSLSDQRMTRIGALLQKSKLDEVPQFLNVIAGDMALIGPRPESLRFADCFGDRFRDVLAHTPGIFGPNQVLFRHEDALLTGRSDVEAYYRQVLFPLKASIDLGYFAQRSLGSDLNLILSAAIAILGGAARTDTLVLGSIARPSASAPRLPPKADLSLET